MIDCCICERRARFRLDAYESDDFPMSGNNLVCGEHLAVVVIALEAQLSRLDDSDCLCVSVLDEPTVAERSARAWELTVRKPLPGPLTKSAEPHRLQ